MANEAGNSNELYRELPSIDRLVGSLSKDFASGEAGRANAVFAARYLLDELRLQIGAGHHDFESLQRQIDALSESLSRAIAELDRYSLRPVINATGVILHTNLGRAPLSQRALNHIIETAGGYCNLEFDLSSGMRGRRERIAEDRLLMVLARQTKIHLDELRSNYGVFVANNCAAAIFLTLNALAAGGEVLVSRGELIEIGGGFRIPEILERAGATLREIGTTNKTRLEDYENAITANTKLILRVHRSNFRITGFTERPSLLQLVRLGQRHNLPVVEDQGTGTLAPFMSHSLKSEPVFAESVLTGADVICASGDKLLGGPQAGLIFARQNWMKQISRNPLARAFRVDKLTYAALEATLVDYATGSEDEIPVLRMIRLRPEDILQRAEALAAGISRQCLSVSIHPGHSVIGGGTALGTKLRTHLIQLAHRTQSAAGLMKKFRESSPALIARVAMDHVLLDLRTVPPQLDAAVTEILNSVPA